MESTTTGSVRVICFGGERGEFRLVGHRRLIVRGSGSCGRQAAERPRQWGHAAQWCLMGKQQVKR